MKYFVTLYFTVGERDHYGPFKSRVDGIEWVKKMKLKYPGSISSHSNEIMTKPEKC